MNRGILLIVCLLLPTVPARLDPKPAPAVTPVVSPVATPADRASGWTRNIPDSARPVIAGYIDLYLTGSARDRVVDAFSRARWYLPFVSAALEARGLPKELAWLPIIESGYRPEATSPSGASGIWQLMPATASDFGLRMSDGFDERRDIVASTGAALDKLASDYARFGSWELALAAYNCGTGCVSQAIESTGLYDYWSLREAGAFPPETRTYLPKYLAILAMVDRANEYGYGDWRPDLTEWTTIPVVHPVRLDTVAKAAGVSPTLLRRANAELLAGVTPPSAALGSGRYLLKAPVEFADTLARIMRDPEVRMAEYLIHRIKPGDTLSSLASRYGVEISALTNFNPGIQPRFLQINSGVLIPAVKTAESKQVYVVESGDTVWGIARSYGVSVEELTRSNQLKNPDRIHPGMTLAIPARVQ